MLIRYSDGHVEMARLLGAKGEAMRVSFPQRFAVVELTRIGGRWLTEHGSPVHVDFTAASSEREWLEICDRLIGLDEDPPWDADSLLAECVPGPCARREPFPEGPFAAQLYERFARGATIEQLADELGIPAERVEMRVRAAESWLLRHRRKSA